MKKHLLAVAVAAVLSAPAMAATDLDGVLPGSGGTYASEIVIAPTGTTLAAGAAADQKAISTFGASFSTNAVAYVRFDLSGATWAAAPAYAVNDSAAAPALISVAQGGAVGQGYVIFAVAPSASGENLVNAAVGTLTANGLTLTAQGAVGVTYKLFETLTNAANNTLPLKTASGNLVGFSPAISIVAGTNQASVADVASEDGAYLDFLAQSGYLLGNLATRAVASFTATHTPRALASGAASTVGAIVGATNAITVTGDLSFANDVLLSSNSDCTAGGSASAVTPTGATFGGLAAATVVNGLPWFVCVESDGVNQIVAGGYTGAVDLVPLSAAFVVADGATGTGSITRNGTVLKAAFAEGSTVAGTSSAISLANTRSAAAPFTTSCLTGTGRVAGNSGTVAANTGTRFGITSAGGLGCPSGTRGIELTFAVPTGSVIGSVVRQNLSTGTAGFDGMTGNQ